ncbi:MAG: hypothetical protein V4772_15885 [Pseudomonadota bacterium]
MAANPDAVLLCIVEVEKSDRVQCQNPGCGHTVWKAIHIVQDNGTLMVLGSTCFQTRYGGFNALGNPSYGSGDARKLTPEERLLLQQNTRELLAWFETEQQRLRAEAEKARANALKALQPEREKPVSPSLALLKKPLAQQQALAQSRRIALPPVRPVPWPWMKPGSSMAYFKLRDGSGWVRVQRSDGRQMLAPLPVFDGWDEALPSHIGRPDMGHIAYELPDVVGAIAYLRQHSERALISGVWREIAAAAAKP